MSTITNPVDNSVERELPTQQDKVQNTENKKVQDAVQTVIAANTEKAQQQPQVQKETAADTKAVKQEVVVQPKVETPAPVVTPAAPKAEVAPAAQTAAAPAPVLTKKQVLTQEQNKLRHDNQITKDRWQEAKHSKAPKATINALKEAYDRAHAARKHHQEKHGHL